LDWNSITLYDFIYALFDLFGGGHGTITESKLSAACVESISCLGYIWVAVLVSVAQSHILVSGSRRWMGTLPQTLYLVFSEDISGTMVPKNHGS